MENPKFKRSFKELQNHLLRTHNCCNTKTFVYRPVSSLKYEIKKCPHMCHSYFCKSCAKIKQAKLRKRLNNLKVSDKLRFLTLTLNTWDYSPEQSIDKISYFFEIFVKLLRYRKYKFQYFKIIELTKNHRAHIHCLISCYIPNFLVRHLWKQITGSWIVDIELINNRNQANNYVMKYISKSVNTVQNSLFYMLRKRRYSYSQNFFLPSVQEPPFILSRFQFYDDKDYYNTVYHFFYLKFEEHKIIQYIFLN